MDDHSLEAWFSDKEPLQSMIILGDFSRKPKDTMNMLTTLDKKKLHIYLLF